MASLKNISFIIALFVMVAAIYWEVRLHRRAERQAITICYQAQKNHGSHRSLSQQMPIRFCCCYEITRKIFPSPIAGMPSVDM